ncbi:transcription elongation factor GreB [Oceaniserpentilla sp. 4NH20-0058]|uniref:transcription elongation factor GreB n=1 Tax=Oceaniserpentilla sp. 4NH20-0058 TaxID=3127660 RepID=UPI00310BFB7A
MKTQLITEQGFAALKDELDHLWRVYRPEITQKVTWAASLGDRSENADYKENKRILRQIDSRVRYLSKCIETLKVVPYSQQQEGKVFFGAYVEVENEQGDTKQFRIVGPEEIYSGSQNISIDSPMARALLSKEQDDEVAVKTPSGLQTWLINHVRYQPFD